MIVAPSSQKSRRRIDANFVIGRRACAVMPLKRKKGSFRGDFWRRHDALEKALSAYMSVL